MVINKQLLNTQCKSIFSFLVFTTGISVPAFSADITTSGNLSLETRLFQHDGAFEGQGDSSVSLSFQPEVTSKWDNDHKSFTFIPFYRWDSEDDERSHGDIRQLDATASKGDWEVQGGISKVFWGVTESQHLVDIINQTDTVDGVDGEDKLGQPMLRVSRIMDDGSLDIFVLPYFRERTFPGLAGRFRLPTVIDADNPSYESDDEEKHVDYAARLNKTLGDFDVGLSYFDGTSRQPSFTKGLKNGEPVLIPHYSLMNQVGLDFQYTGEAIIWKLEALNRRYDKPLNKDYSAAVGGFEYTIPAITTGGGDLGLLAEYHNDSRGEKGGSPFQNDVFLGARLSLNDEDSSQLLAGAFIDLDNGSKSFRLEASKRMGNGLKLNIEGQLFTDIDDKDPTNVFSQDDHVQIELQKYF